MGERVCLGRRDDLFDRVERIDRNHHHLDHLWCAPRHVKRLHDVSAQADASPAVRVAWTRSLATLRSRRLGPGTGGSSICSPPPSVRSVLPRVGLSPRCLVLAPLLAIDVVRLELRLFPVVLPKLLATRQ